MSAVNFGSLSVGDVFTYGGVEYSKTEKKKISCCKFVNAVGIKNPTAKIGIADNAKVEKSEPVVAAKEPPADNPKETVTKKGDKDKA